MARDSLRQSDVKANLDRATDAALQSATGIRVPIERDPIEPFFDDAYHGRRRPDQEHK